MDLDSTMTNHIHDEIVSDIKVTSLFPTGLLTSFCKMHGAFIVLEDHIVMDGIPWASRKCQTHRIMAMVSLIPTNSTSVKLWVLNFCLEDIE